VRVLIVRLSSLGDVIHALPLAENAAAAHAEVGWLVEPAFAGLLQGNPHCAAIFTADTKAWRRRPLARATRQAVGELRGKLRAFRPDVVVDAQGLWKSALAARGAGAPVVGFSAGARREGASAILASIRVAPAAEARHIVDRNLALLEGAGIPVAARAPDARYLFERVGAEAREFLAGLPRPFVVVHPGAARPEKAWGEERFARLARGLAARGRLHCVVSWGPGDEGRVARMRALAPEAAVAPLLDFPGLAALARASVLFCGGDTGPLHLADAAGAATLALFGPTDPARNGPYRDRRGVVTRMHDVADDTVLARALELTARSTSHARESL
jgi:heptosyltransferase-1